ncbi:MULTISPECIES: DEAD/DEAH box helicase family protein [Pectobacterium]|uniref:DEAD/DEAH box helicase n=1 Tax=Pectobacterium aquaticum TaxID=2204145 RepID=A0AA93AMQ6_9GAMM|nr:MULTISPECIES: DEAD/DEAH box helicase family protein [Pectobacterium]QLL92821.1 DEAD/DEAH box helicase family protein [Pectobacterium carotovorum]RRO21509.1 DEAD/DEAH box helicase [Pectobacterium aquaticum]
MSGFHLDLSKISKGIDSNTAIPPRDIFTALPSKNTKFQYPRDVQAEVWEKWFDVRNNPTSVIKMNTGSGKTSVGLIILKSCINEGVGPVVYLVPDNYLVEQVIEEAEQLGIPVTADEKSQKFIAGQEILVTNIFKIVNGRSVFGVGDEGEKIQIGSIIIDDAHACLSTIEDQFTLNISRDNPAYDSLFRIFENSLMTQGAAKTLEIKAGDRNAYVRVPFWKWHESINEITEILLANKDSKDLAFKWSLIKENILLSKCVVSASKIEISPHCIPIHMIPSLSNARRKIFMTATLVDESILASHFGITDESLSNPITPKTIGDIGDRMILMPQVINPDLTDLEIKVMCKEISTKHNVVVIVPSEYRATFWHDVANKILDKNNLYSGVQELRSQHVGLVILINRYDGIDLPNTACRLLVIDGLPDIRRLVDKTTQSVLLGSEKTKDEIIQKIEQGMGRGVRSSDDFCGVILLGKALNGAVFLGSSLEKFSPATKAQIKLSQELVKIFPDSTITTIKGALDHCLLREPQWTSMSKGVLAGLTLDQKEIDTHTINKRKAYDLASRNMSHEAAKVLREDGNVTDKIHKGFLKEHAAEYVNLYDKSESQILLQSASSDNYRVLKPLAGVGYNRLDGAALEQARECSNYLRGNFKNSNEIVVHANSILENLIFMEGTSNPFENAIDQVAKLIGFRSQRPENDTGKGPDNLWLLGDNDYLVIECKNGATADRISKHDCNQLNGSGAWFRHMYDQTATFHPVMIHHSNFPEYAATLSEGSKIMTIGDLDKFKNSVLDFIKAICSSDKVHDDKFIRERLISCRLRAVDIINNYSRNFRAS